MDNDELVVSADRVAFLKEKVDKDIAELGEKLKQGQFFLRRLDEHDGQHLSAYPAGKQVSTGGLGYFASQANSEIPEDIGTFPTQFQENSGISQRTRDQSAADNWKATRRGTLWLVAGKYNQDITSGFSGMANTPGDERQILGTQTPMFGVSQVVGSDRKKGLDQIAPALVARAIKLRKDRKDVSPESVLSSPLRTSITGAMSSGEAPKRPKYPRTPTYGVAIGKGDDLFASAESWTEFKKIYGDREVVFLDYETTGLVFDEFGKATSNGAPVQIGAVKWRDGKVTERFNVFINPGEKLGEWSRDNLKDKDGNPLTDEWLSGQPSIADAHRQLAEFAGSDAIMGVQNASFDKNVLEDALKASGIEWTPSGYIDTKEISSMVLPRWTPENPDGPAKMGSDGVKRPSNGLKEITEYLGVELGTKHHTADADAEATAEVMQKIIDGAIQNGWSDRIFSKSTRQAHIDKVNQKHLEEIEEFKKARDAFLVEVERLATKRDDGSAKNATE
jgi:DNA polymerase III epsilon subunit-like protein